MMNIFFNINIILSIFCYLIFSSVVKSDNILLHSVTGTVGRGNFTYWSLGYTGHIVVTLASIYGDVDLYVAEQNTQPTYEPEKYDLHSASCGEDVVEIPKSFRRPVGIGIYGHPFYENSTYILEVYYDINKSSEENVFESEDGNKNEEGTTDDENSKKQQTYTHKNSPVKKYKLKSKLISSFWAFVEVFEMFFL